MHPSPTGGSWLGNLSHWEELPDYLVWSRAPTPAYGLPLPEEVWGHRATDFLITHEDLVLDQIWFWAQVQVQKEDGYHVQCKGIASLWEDLHEVVREVRPVGSRPLQQQGKKIISWWWTIVVTPSPWVPGRCLRTEERWPYEITLYFFHLFFLVCHQIVINSHIFL